MCKHKTNSIIICCHPEQSAVRSWVMLHCSKMSPLNLLLCGKNKQSFIQNVVKKMRKITKLIYTKLFYHYKKLLACFGYVQ